MNHGTVATSPSESGRLIGAADDIVMRLAGIENQLHIHQVRLLGHMPEPAESTNVKAQLADEAFVTQLDARLSSMRTFLMQIEGRIETLSRF